MKKHDQSWLAIPAVLVLGVSGATIHLTKTGSVTTGERLLSESDAVRKGEGWTRPRPSSAADRANRARQPVMDEERSALWQRLIELPDEDAIALLLSLAGRDITAAFELALALGELDGKAESAREALRRLIGRDLEAAVAWGADRDPSPEMDLFWAAAVDFTADSDPSMAFDLSSRTRGGLRLTLLESIFAEWAGEDPEAARRAARNLDTPEERFAAHIAILSSELDRDLGKALSWIESVTDLELQDALYYHAARDWAARDPTGAAVFADSLVESDYKTHVAGRVLESWVREDADSAMAWASTLPDQESREEAISRGIRLTLDSSPEEAATLALHLPAESDRAAALDYVVSAWIERDPDALAKWISEVPDFDTKARMTRMMQDHLSSARR